LKELLKYVICITLIDVIINK